MHIREKSLIHTVLGHGYLFLFFSGLMGLAFDLFHPIRIYGAFVPYIGFLFLLLGTLLVFWAQFSSNKHRNPKSEAARSYHFHHGPYVYMKSPTHVGIGLLLVGFGFFVSSLSVVVSVIFASLLLRISFLRKHDVLLSKQFGEIYDEYRKKIKF